LKEVHGVNENPKKRFIKLIEDKLWNIKNKTIGVLGLAFKPDTDDMRNAPSIDIIKTLQSEGATIKAYDPQAVENCRSIFDGVEYASDPYALAKDCECLILMTEWDEFKTLDFSKIKELLKQPVLFDGRNLYDREELVALGYDYHCIGRS
jgi:UDPglucose 6-dehydrogenase